MQNKRKAWGKVAVILTILYVCFGLPPACTDAEAQTWHTTNQTTVGWTEPTEMADGSANPADLLLEYVVYLSNAVTDPSKANPVQVARVPDLTALITLNVEGKFFVGLKAVRIVDGEDVTESDMIWSDNPQHVLNGETFGIRYFLAPGTPGNLAPVGG